MPETFIEQQTTEQQQIHELRIAVISLSQRALVGSFSSPELFRHHQPLRADGLIGITHEQRATTYFNNEPGQHGVPHLKMLGRLGSVARQDDDERIVTEVSGTAVYTAAPYDFSRFQYRRYDLNDIADESHQELQQPGSTTLNTIDAGFIIQAVALARAAGAR